MKTVERYMDGFRRSDQHLILSCLTDDVEWTMPGIFHLVGKSEFEREIENSAFVGSPAITITRMIEEGDVVAAAGAVRVGRKGGSFLNAVFCDVFAMKDSKIKGLTKANLWVSSTTEDVDIFATLQLFTPDNKEVTFEGASEPAVPIAQGWLRVSHRKLHPKLSMPWRPYHAHDGIQKLVPGNVYEVQVELWPTCIVVPKGYALVLKLQGKDFSRSEKGGVFTGPGPFLHTHPKDRPPPSLGVQI